MNAALQNTHSLPGMKIQPDLSPERVKMHIRTRFNPIRNLTPETLARQLDNFKAGYLRDFALTADLIEERDDVLKSVAPKRKKSAARHGWEILALDDSPEAAAQKEALEYFYNNLSCTNAIDLNERGGLKLLVRQMMDAVGKRYAIHEIIWQPRQDKGDHLTAEFRFVPLWFFENTTGKLRFLPTEGATEGVDLEERGWMVTVGEGIMVACSIAWMFKRLPLQDWLTYCEKFGLPGVLGKTDSAKGSSEWDSMVEAVENFAVDWAAVTSRDNTIELVEVKGQGNHPHPPLVERMDRALATLWRGADLSTISKGQGLGASLQGDETDILDEDDTEMISETLNIYVDKWVIQYLFGPGAKQLAYIAIGKPQRQNIELDLKVDEFLVRHGVPVSVSDTLERYGRPAPDQGEPLLSAPTAAPAPGSFALPNESVGEKLAAVARDHFAKAVATDLQPVRNRLERILGIADPDVLAARLKEFLAELPRLLKSINADPASAGALEQSLSAALFNGLAKETHP